MADNQRSYHRDVRGKFVKVDPERDAIAPGLGAPKTFAYDLEPRHAPAADVLAQGGQASPLRARNPELVHPDDAVHPVYGVQGGVLRTAARGAGPMDPSAYLTGAG